MNLKTFTHVSPSQIETFLDIGQSGCNRKWWLSKILGLPVPQHPSAALGEAVHKGQEAYIETGDEAQVHALAKGTLPLLRAFRERKLAQPTKLLIEHSLKRPLRNGLTMVGRIDLLDIASGLDAEPLVFDWKTAGSPAYAKTPEELRSNVQMLVYAKEAVILDIERNGLPADPTVRRGVKVAHGVIPTKGGVAPFVRDARISLDEIHAGWGRILTITDAMLEVAKATSPTDVKPNKSACNAFGGCAFRERCAALATTVPVSKYATVNDQPGDSATSPETTTMSMPSAPYETALKIFGGDENQCRKAFAALSDADFAAWKAGGTAASAPVNRGVNPPESTQAAATPAPVAQAAPAVEASDAEKIKLLQSLGWADDDIACLPEEEFENVVKHNWRFEDVAFDMVPAEDEDGNVVYDYTNVRKKKVVKAEPVAEPAAPARRRGRPPGSKNKATVVVEPEVVQTPAVYAKGDIVAPKAKTTMRFEVLSANKYPDGWRYECRVDANTIRSYPEYDLTPYVEPAPVQAEEPTPVVTTAAGSPSVSVGVVEPAPVAVAVEQTPVTAPVSNRFALYIDCLPEQTEYRVLDNVLAPIMAQAASEYRDEKTGKVAPLTHYALMPFNRGPGTVGAYVLANITEIAKGSIVVDTRSPCAMAVLEVLRPVADFVVRGVR